MTRRLIRLCVALTALLALPATAQDAQRPNFLIVVADDLGWSDPGFLGSRIKTPTLDMLARRGIFMSHFYVAPTCSPTRAMLMTGVSNHAAGVGTMHNLQAKNQMGHLAYGAQLHDGVVTVAEMLRAHGYSTMMSGKWHLAIDENQRPHRRGFQHSFGLAEGGASHFTDEQIITPMETVTYLENGQPTRLDSDFYSTIGYTDKILEYIDEAGDQPFFAYLTYTAPHDPLQVPDDWLDRYDGVFDDGPEVSREERRQRLIELGHINADAEMADALNFPSWLDSHHAPWGERSDEERRTHAKRMEIYAAMVELLDQELGRVIAHLEANDQLSNTYIMFLSDNGAAVTTPLAYRGNTREWLHENFDLSREAMGQMGSFTSMGRDWAHASNTPFSRFKGTVGEGGVRSPLIVAGPGLESGVTRTMPAHVTDLVPTVYELAGINPADDPLYEGKLQPQGTSIVPVFEEASFDDARFLFNELFGNSMVRKGRWKAVWLSPPFGSGEWELFDIVADPSATNNLAEAHQAVISELVAAYDEFAQENGVIPPDPRRSLRSSIFYEGPCNWWCNAKFSFLDTLANPTGRMILLASFLTVLGLILFFPIRWLRRRRHARS